MMTRIRTGVLVAVVALAAATLGSPAAAGADGAAAKVETFERLGFQPGPGGGLVLNWGFSPRVISVPSGSIVKWTNATEAGELHAVTLVSAAHVPQTIDEVFNCGVCNEALAKHDADGKPPIDHLLVNVGKTGLNTEGDSRILLPHQSLFATVTAPAGTTLNYVCSIHPWMQAKIHVT